MPGTNLNDIQIFMAVADAGSFVGGGKAMGLTRSAAGKAVGRLEDRLGTRLLNRTTRTLSLTDQGRVFYDHGLRVLAAVDEAEGSVAGRAGTPRGLLRLAVPDAFGRLVVLPLLRPYLQAWPELQVEMSFSDRLTDLVEEGFDLAIRIGVTSLDTSLVSRVIARQKVMLCAAPSYIAERGMPRDVDDLAGHDCLLFSSAGRRQAWRFPGADGTGVKAPGRSRLRLDSGEALREAAVTGLGIAFLPEFLIGPDLAAGRLTQVLPRDATDEVNILALYPSRRLLEPGVRRFIDLLSDTLAHGRDPAG